MGRIRLGKRHLAVSLASLALLITFGSFQNFSDIGLGRYEYSVVELGHLGGALETTIPLGMNSKGQIVGQSQNSSGEWHAFLWSEGKMTDLGTLGGNESRAISINDNGDVFGESRDSKGGARRFRWSNGAITDLGPVESGVIRFDETNRVGNISALNGTTQEAAVWENGKPESLGTLGGAYSVALSYSADGKIAGSAENARKILRPTIWTRPGKKKYVARDIFESLNDPQLEGSANGVNSAGEVVGNAQTPKGTFAFVWTETQNVRNLNSLLRESDPSSTVKAWVLQKASAINECGQIAGEGTTTSSGGGKAFLLTPLTSRPGCKN